MSSASLRSFGHRGAEEKVVTQDRAQCFHHPATSASGYFACVLCKAEACPGLHLCSGTLSLLARIPNAIFTSNPHSHGSACSPRDTSIHSRPCSSVNKPLTFGDPATRAPSQCLVTHGHPFSALARSVRHQSLTLNQCSTASLTWFA